jgi:hypothetical protein
MNTDHKLGRSEAIRDASRAISILIDKASADIIARYDELEKMRLDGTMVWAEDDERIQNLKGQRDALYAAHAKVCSL